MLTIALTFNDAARAFVVSAAGLPVGAGAVMLYQVGLDGAVKALLGTALADTLTPTALVGAVAGNDGLYLLRLDAVAALPLAGAAPVVLEQSAIFSYQLTLDHLRALDDTYASHANAPAASGATLGLCLRRLARLSEATAVYAEGDLFHAHQYLQKP